jgi:hypothetical protein
MLGIQAQHTDVEFDCGPVADLELVPGWIRRIAEMD